MKQTVITSIIILLIIVLLSVIFIGSRNKNNIGKQTILFYGNSCPHCKDVEDWMVENKIDEKISLIKKEVYDNRRNALELEKYAKNCGISTDSISVPFLYAEGKCITGRPDITSYLSRISEISKSVNLEERSAQ